MHISEGFLSAPLLSTGWLIAGAGVSYGLKKTDSNQIVRVAMTASIFFLASLINIKVGPSSTHLSLTGAVGLLLGWRAFPAIFIALLLQAALFQSGGLLVLGVNTVSMASAAVWVHLLFRKSLLSSSKKIIALSAFFAGFLGVIFSAGFLSFWLFISDPKLLTAVKTLLVLHFPIAIVEGVVTSFSVTFLKQVAPDLINYSSN